ncbi:TIGR04283 family arsenosugar biosynthesis glycosyltransferase [Kordia sp. YSTF-M3]|uniref:TIGR04283 family arsenosugar biosynthesis glycosyltransferase n=1 Tax=Kordia aestuariivivens TaxID=2759037 RepID=A0ABR7QA66_9FLAO|nr:TIGR04283 family arsenosugar biosynthesis glycosyltransferase [Kordia aestuariivivens]MBC8755461.1 TIGR04283 family arsenosugar biosynthesis glycosyltransferase [Kordia aestuariivivens]
MNSISIIIPIFNEANNIVSLLNHVLKSLKYQHHEILLIDGGSTDNTVEIVTEFISTFHTQHNSSQKRCVDSLFENKTSKLHIQLFSSEKGRAKQMNFGAQKATGNILYFLHADTFPPKHFDAFILTEVKEGNQAGCFRLKFDYPHPVLLVSQFFTRFNISWCRGGDQSLFVMKSLFDELKGYNETYSIYEDCEFINRLYDEEEFTVIPKSVKTSARKYKVNGTWKLQYHFAMIHIKKSKGATPEELHAYYKKHIAS